MRSRTWRPLLAVLCAPLLGSFCNGPPAPPPPDACDVPSTGTADALTIEAQDPSGNFVALVDGTVVERVTGGQGAEMIVLRFRLSGASAPSCMAQHTTLLDEKSTSIASSSVPLATYPDANGTRLTKPFYFVIGYGTTSGQSVTLASDAAGQSITVQLYLDAHIMG